MKYEPIGSHIEGLHNTIKHHASALALNITTGLYTLSDDGRDFDRVVEISVTVRLYLYCTGGRSVPRIYFKGLDDIMSFKIQD